MRCIVVTPEETILDVETDFVAAPLFDGEVGILPRHSPLIGRLGYGELRLKKGAETSRYYVDGGFLQVADDVISVLTGRAIPAAKIDRATAEKQLAESLARKAANKDEIAVRDRLVSQARGQLRVAR
jgi:F-type H+-transporting ATPase subunit epsilon